ncbi:MAG: cytochrome-c peroxidase [Deferribacterales bacterium]|nr:cytochrome-c peroxidase [Deferribacterales bacterium]
MKRITFFAVLVGVFCFATSAMADKLLDQAKEVFEPIPAEAKKLEGNPATPEKVLLGKMLFFEPRLSKSMLISCNTCHNLSFGGDDYQETSIGHGWQKGPRNAPTVLNSVYNHAQFWDGRAGNLAEQAKGPIQASVEMAATPEHVVTVLKSIPEYVELFKKAFPGQKDPVTFDNMALAIEVFEATLVTPNSPFDKWLKGDAKALNKEEKKGLAVYLDKGCADCHGGVNFTSDGYYPFGVVVKPSDNILAGDKGRAALEGTDGEEGFKAPTLRNIEYTAPYFHSGKVWSLDEAVALMSSSQLGIELTKDEVKSIVVFLKALTGEQPKVEYPVLPPSTDATPKPVYK